MKALRQLFVMCLFILMLCAMTIAAERCSPPAPKTPEEANQRNYFIVGSIMEDESDSGIAKYYLKAWVPAWQEWRNDLIYRDSAGKFQMGDTIILVKK